MSRWLIGAVVLVLIVVGLIAVSGAFTLTPGGGRPVSGETPVPVSDEGDDVTTRRRRPARPQEQQPPSESGNCVVRVRVTAEDGTPVADAPVAIDDASDRWTEGATDTAGVTAFRNVAPGGGSVVVRMPGFLQANRRFTAAPDRDTEVPVQLQRGATVAVQVVDSVTGAPVAGALVDFESVLGLECDAVETDAEGHAVGLVDPETPMVLEITAAGYQDACTSVRSGPLGGSAAPLVVRLVPAGSLTGVVRTPRGEPVAEAYVYVRREGSSGYERELTSEDGGVYATDGLILGRTYVLTASADGWSDSEAVRAAPTASHRVLSEDLVLRPPTTVVVRTVDDDGKPVGTVHVDVLHRGGDHGVSSVHSEQRVSIEPGRCVVRASASGRVAAHAERSVDAGETWELTLTLSVGAEISGTVVDPDGAPVEDASVNAVRDEDQVLIDDTTDAKGSFRLAPLAPGRHDLRVEGGPDFEHLLVRDLSAPSAGVRLALARSSRLRMRLEFEEVAPFDGERLVAISGVGSDGEPIVRESPIGADGEVDTPWPHDAQGDIAISVPGFAATPLRVSVARGDVADLGVLRLTRGVALQGRVTYPLGHAADGIAVEARQQGTTGHVISTTTEEDGTFRLEGLRGGRAVIEALPDDWPGATYDVEVGSGSPLDLVLPKIGVLWVRVVAPDGGPEAGVTVVAVDERGRELPWTREETDAGGSVQLRLAAGPATLVVGGSIRVGTEVRPDDLTVKEIQLPR